MNDNDLTPAGKAYFERFKQAERKATSERLRMPDAKLPRPPEPPKPASRGFTIIRDEAGRPIRLEWEAPKR